MAQELDQEGQCEILKLFGMRESAQVDTVAELSDATPLKDEWNAACGIQPLVGRAKPQGLADRR